MAGVTGLASQQSMARCCEFLNDFDSLPSDGSVELSFGLMAIGFGIIAADWLIWRHAKRPPDRL
jgi:hypothetical protein